MWLNSKDLLSLKWWFTYHACNETGDYTFESLTADSPMLSSGWLWASSLGLTTVMIIVGLIGNIFSIATLITEDLKRAGNLYLLSMSIADIIVIVLNTVVQEVNLYFGEYVYPQSICNFLGYLSGTYCFVSVFSIVAVALDRYIAICHHNIYLEWFNRRNVINSIIFMWVFGFVSISIGIEIPGMLKFGLTHARTCCINFLSPMAGVIILSEIILPFFAVCLLYVRMALVIFESKQTMKKHKNKAGNEIDLSKRDSKKEVEVYIMMLAVFITFGICWLPFCFSIVLRTFNVYCASQLFNAISEFFVLFNSSLNPILYGVFNKSFRQAYYRIANILSFGLIGKCFGDDKVYPVSVGGAVSKFQTTTKGVIGVTVITKDG